MAAANSQGGQMVPVIPEPKGSPHREHERLLEELMDGLGTSEF
jgi:hypothetical protein